MMTKSEVRMPPEWDPQTATWVSWPHNKETWPDNLDQARTEFCAFVAAIARDQPVNVMAAGAAADVAARKLQTIDNELRPNIRIVPIATNDAWARDYAPTFVKEVTSNKLISIDWRYNAWGGKYPPFDDDQKVAEQVATELQIENRAGGICFEGGAIEINGAGCLLTTRSCGLNANRNPGTSQREFEAALEANLGARQIVWLPGDGVQGDDTDGHIDQLARFTNDRTIVYAWTQSADDPRRKGLAKNLAALEQQLPDCELIPLLLPETFEVCNRVIPASYCNFLITNGSVLVPQFDVARDASAVETLSKCFPNRKLVPLRSRNLSVGLGSFHCLSQQQPA